ncbi:MAG: hypothetical protein HRU70_01755 [Phycisphaeraceae bacterium]|nr:MAG: hypothetical protein HRU70_01755 [Phycisphaeraceae bacterium]
MTHDPAVTPVPGGRLSVRLAGDATPPVGSDAAWARACAANPRLHDGPLLAVVRAEPGLIVCERSTYRSFVTGLAIGVPVKSLGVSGLLWTRDAGRIEILMGRRATGVRLYAGLWETAPRGSVRPPPTSGSADLPPDFLAHELRQESLEELGLVPWGTAPSPIALVHDDHARSLDAVLAAEIQRDPAPAAASWEYSHIQWMPWESPSPITPDTLSPPTRALFDALRLCRPQPPWSTG